MIYVRFVPDLIQSSLKIIPRFKLRITGDNTYKSHEILQDLFTRADNPASCSCGGYKESSQAYRPYRHCLIRRSELALKFKECELELRTPALHDDQLEMMEDEDEDRSERSKEFGINTRSVLDELQYFSVASGALLPDIMHDVLEGLLQYETKLLLRQFVREDNFFTLSQLNQQIEAIELGYMESKCRPTPITSTTLSSEDNNLKQSGT